MVAIKHKFQSEKGDGTDPTKVQPSNWNEEHDIVMSTGRVLGRASANEGPAEELLAGEFGRAVLAAATKAAAAAVGLFTTGDAKLTFKTVADSGWIMLNDGSIGNASSGATTLADETAKDLFVQLWESVPDQWAPVSGGRGVSGGLNDFNAGKKMTLPKALGRALVIAGAGAGLTSRVLGSAFGSEGVTIELENLPDLDLPVDIPAGQGTHSHSYLVPTQNVVPSGSFANVTVIGGFTSTNTSSAVLPALSGTASMNGDNVAIDNTQASIGFNVMVKL